MKSIKTKLIIGILLIISIFFGGIIAYSITFKSYFQKEKISEMKNIINSIEKGQMSFLNEENQKSIIEVSDEYNVQIIIEDLNTGKVIFSTAKANSMQHMGMGMGMGFGKCEVERELSDNDNIKSVIELDKQSGVRFLSSKAMISGSTRITVRTPITIIEEASFKSLKLLLLILLPLSLIIVFITIIFANKFTNPIIEITKKTKSIEKLEFGDKINVLGQDEISNLGNSVNSLSHTIETTLEELNLKNQKLIKLIENEKKNEILRREFVSSVSHELKSPITVISGYAQVLSSDVLLNSEDVSYYISIINDESKRMEVIVSDLLDLYKLQSKTFNLKLKDCNLKEIILNLINKNSLILCENNVKIESELMDCIRSVDKIRIEQAIQNYLNNAISHLDSNRLIKITLTKDGYIGVFNSGEVISEENLEKIWHGFVRADKVRNYKEKRVGLGLSIVKEIITLHNGSYGVTNLYNGVEFWIKLN